MSRGDSATVGINTLGGDDPPMLAQLKKKRRLTPKRIWAKYVCCDKRLIGQFTWFIITQFLVFYSLYATLLPSFTQTYFSEWTFKDIEGEYVH